MHLFRGKEKLVKLAAGFIVILVVFFVVPGMAFSETTTELKNKVNQITEQRELLEKEMQGYADQRKFLEEKIKSTEESIKENEKKITENEEELKKQQSFLSEYLRVIYEDGQVSFVEQIVKAKTFSDFVDRNEYLNSVRDKLKATVDRVDNLRVELIDAKKKIGVDKKILEITKTAYDKQIAAKGTELDKLKAEEIRIRRIFGERLSKAGVAPYCANEGKIVKAKYPVFTFPVNCGYISQGFGNTEFASIDNAYNGNIHNGTDVGIGTGTEIRSIGKGEVYAKGVSPSGGWGNWVMIKHDKVKIKIDTQEREYEFYSLYGHMVSETYLNVGEKVDTNTIVGWVGGTPDWAPHLHFSLFISSSGWGAPSPNTIGAYPGNVIDPLDYMDIPISTSGTDWDPNYAHPYR
jgi:murein DD-endopeptidase MepM/ murein hydrolase activator NlpD